MHISDKAFWVVISFLVGVLLYAFFPGRGIVIFLVGAFLGVCIWRMGMRRFAVAVIALVVAGGLYAGWYAEQKVRAYTIPHDREYELTGRVCSDPELMDQKQRFALCATTLYQGKILVQMERYPAMRYGDMVVLFAVVREPQPRGYAAYLAKQDIFGVVYFPELTRHVSTSAFSLRRSLFDIKRSFEVRVSQVLPAREAAFLSGILLGQRASFSEEFEEQMRRSGTTHLVALSGYNISILAVAAMVMFISIGLGRRSAFWFSLALIIGFVVMTGAQASVVRAAVMGGVLLIGVQAGKIAHMRNLIAFAAAAMVLANPSIVRYDIGFQLSFFALLGIVYLAPVIRGFLGSQEHEGFLQWRTHASATTAAQIMVLPLLLSHFGQFSLIAPLTNVLLLEMIPVTMLAGFCVGAVGYVSIALARVLGLGAYLLLRYQTGVIEFFGSLPAVVELSVGGFIFFVVYYVAVYAVIKKYGKRRVFSVV